MESDERFKHLVSDPRFRTLRKKQRKVVIDERFKPMFEDEKFTLKYSADKRGWRKGESSSDNLKKYYSLDNDANRDGSKNKDLAEENVTENKIEEEGTQDGQDAAIEDEETDDQEDEGNEDEQSEVTASSSSDESESEVEVEEIDISEIKYDWQPLDHDADTADQSSCRLAVQNLDWDQLNVQDLYLLMNSTRPPRSVTLYVSMFGKERLAQEELKGPTELVEVSKDDDDEEELRQLEEKMRVINNQGARKLRPNEYEDADEAFDPKNDAISSRIRRYQLNRMKYYYAIAEFDSVESAEAVYKELDGREFEGTSIELDLRFVPDDVEFDNADERAKCEKMPDLSTYKAPQFINSALQQTSVRFTWDETDIKRQEKLRRAYTEKELDKDDLDAYLASESDSDSDCESDGHEVNPNNDNMSLRTENSRADKYKRLLVSLEEEAERKKKVDVDVEWGDYEADSALVPMKPGKVVRELEDKEDSELGLLVMDVKTKESCEFNPDDERFEAVYTSGQFNIDPSHPSFKRTITFDMIAERKRQRRMLNVVTPLSAPKPK